MPLCQVPLEGWVQIVLFLGHMEGYFWRQDPKRAPGDYEGEQLKGCVCRSIRIPKWTSGRIVELLV